jgi:hypothetical protein
MSVDPMENATAVDDARDAAFDSLMDDMEGDTARADEVFTQLAIEMFTDQFTGPDAAKVEQVVRRANERLAQFGAPWRLRRIPSV